MALGSHHWTLFGYDLRTLPAIWSASWREVLWNQDAPLRHRLDEPVAVRDPWIAAQQTPGQKWVGRQTGTQSSEACAQLLPDQMVLICWLNIPERAEAHLTSALALEVRARSPFPADDTRFGWRIAGREGGVLRVCLAIVSRSAVHSYLERYLTADEMAKTEVWTRVEDIYVVIEGFGEQLRHTRYTRHLKRLFAWCGYALIVSILLMALPVGLRAIQLEHYQQELVSVQRGSAEAVRLRNELAKNNERAQEIIRLVHSTANPYDELLQLTYLLDNTVWLTSLEQRGDKLRIDGMAENAAELMQQLSAQARYSDVRAPSAIRRDPRTGQERFVLDITLAAQEKRQ